MEHYKDLMKQHRVSFDSLEWNSLGPGSKSKILQSGNKNLRLQEFTSDFKDSNWCEKRHVGFVIEGELEIDFQDRKVRFPEGRELLIETGQKHQLRSITSTVLVFLVEDI